MTIKNFDLVKLKKLAFLFGLLFVFAQTFSVQTDAQTRRKGTARTAKKKVAAKRQQSAVDNEKDLSSLAKVTQIDEIALKNLLRRDGANNKPLLVNFWATWCDPCREEFPDLVKLDAEYKGKIDLITVSLDDLAEIKRDVPKFLAEMKAEMPSYLLKTSNDEAAIASVSKSWQGGLPFTILFNEQGETAYFIQGKFKTELLRAEIEKITVTSNSSQITNQRILDLPNLKAQYTYEKGKSDAQIDIANNKFIIRTYGLTPGRSQQGLNELRKKYGIEIFDDSWKPIEYLEGYNEISKAEIKRKFGLEF
jgi:thiol-disulfide isomerase/thioredoxin